MDVRPALGDRGRVVDELRREVERRLADGVEPGDRVGGEPKVERIDVVVELRDCTGADDGRGDTRAVPDPRQRNARGGRPELLRDPFDGFDNVVGAILVERPA
jgi:hypothetical protein